MAVVNVVQKIGDRSGLAETKKTSSGTVCRVNLLPFFHMMLLKIDATQIHLMGSQMSPLDERSSNLQCNLNEFCQNFVQKLPVE